MFRAVKFATALIALGFVQAAGALAEDMAASRAVFESRQLDLVDKGQEVLYRYEKKGSNSDLVGKDFSDDIRLTVTKVNEKGDRDITFKVFTGEYARDAQNWPEFTVNPILIWYLDRSVETMTSLAGGNHNYFKQRVRDAFVKSAATETVKVSYNGKEVEGMKITLLPFSGDANAKKLQGFENAKFTIVLSKDVPGYFYDLASEFHNSGAAGPNVDLHVKLVSAGGTK